MVEQVDSQIVQEKKINKIKQPYLDHCYVCVNPNEIDHTGCNMNKNFYRCVECKSYICEQHLSAMMNSNHKCHPQAKISQFTPQTRCQKCRRLYTEAHYNCEEARFLRENR